MVKISTGQKFNSFTRESTLSLSNQDNNREERVTMGILPPEEDHFVLQLKESRSFKQRNAAHEMTYKVKLSRRNSDLLLSNLLPNLQALFDTLLHHTRQQHGEQGIARVAPHSDPILSNGLLTLTVAETETETDKNWVI